MIPNKIVEIWRAALIEDPVYGDSRDWTHATRVASIPGSFQPAYVSQSDVDRETTFSIWNVYIKIVDVQATDRVLIDGNWYQMDGEPQVHDTLPRIAHIKLRVKRVEN